MKSIKYAYNLLYNIKNLLKVIISTEQVEWNFLTKDINKTCVIHPASKVFGPCKIRNTNIGKGTYISLNASISYATIGNFCSIGPNLVCGWGIHPIDGISTSPAFYSTKKQNGFAFSKRDKLDERKPILIGNDVFIGANVTVLDGVQIGDGAVIGAGAVVSKNIPPYAIAVGSPIKIIKYRFSQEVIQKLLEIKWWDKGVEMLNKVELHFEDINSFLREVEQKQSHVMDGKRGEI
jgi:virginiamycin A acetyltransferase